MARLRIRQIPLSATLVAVVLALTVGHVLGLLGPIEHGVSRVLAPVQATLYGVGSWIHGLYSRPERQAAAELELEAGDLRQRVVALTAENAQLRALVTEQAEASGVHEYLAARGYTAVTARVIGKNLEPTVHVLLINRGEVDGVRVDAPVISGDGLLVGHVYRVHPRTAEVLILSDSQSRVAGAILPPDDSSIQTIGVVSGDRGLSLRLELVPQSIALADGQVVVTSGLESGVPSGLTIGKIERIERSANAFFQTAGLRPAVDFATVTTVSVLSISQTP